MKLSVTPLVFVFLTILVSVTTGQERVDLIQASEPFTPSGLVSMTDVSMENRARASMRMPLEKPHKIESGSLNGVQYRFYYTDGSGSFGNNLDRIGMPDLDNNWRVACKKDAIDDSKYCYMSFHDLTVWKFSSGGYRVSVGGETYPGSEVAVRIDGAPAITGSKEIFGGPNADKIIEGLKAGKQVTTRYVRWPAGTNKDDTFQLVGFNEAFSYINWALSKIK